MKPVDTTKKSNIKCDHCEHFKNWPQDETCKVTGDKKNYWNRCKSFEWKKKYFEVKP